MEVVNRIAVNLLTLAFAIRYPDGLIIRLDKHVAVTMLQRHDLLQNLEIFMNTLVVDCRGVLLCALSY